MTTPRDFARIGQLMLDNGYWNGKKIINSNFLKNVLLPLNKIKNMDISGGYLMKKVKYLDIILQVI